MTSRRPTAERERLSDALFQAIADPCRRRILFLLSEQDLPLNRISAHFDMRRPSVIKHLRVLKASKLVKSRRVGRQSIHRLNPLPLLRIKSWLAQFEAVWESHLQKLKTQIESES